MPHVIHRRRSPGRQRAQCPERVPRADDRLHSTGIPSALTNPRVTWPSAACAEHHLERRNRNLPPVRGSLRRYRSRLVSSKCRQDGGNCFAARPVPPARDSCAAARLARGPPAATPRAGQPALLSRSNDSRGASICTEGHGAGVQVTDEGRACIELGVRKGPMAVAPVCSAGAAAVRWLSLAQESAGCTGAAAW